MPRSITKKLKKMLQESAVIREYLWKYRVHVAFGLLALVVVDILEVVPPFILKEAVDGVVSGEGTRELLILAFAYFATGIVQGIGRFGWRIFLLRSSHFSGQDIRFRFSKQLFRLGMGFFDKTPVGDLMTRATSDVEAVRMAVGTGLLVFADAMFYFFTIPVAMYFLSPKLTLLAFIPLPIIPWIVIRNEREIHKRYEKVQTAYSDLSSMVQEGLAGIRMVKAFAKEDVQAQRLSKKSKEFVDLNMHLARVQTAFGPTLDFSMSVGMVILLYFGGRELIQANTLLTLGTFVAFQRYIQKMVWPMAAIGMAVSFYQKGVSSSERIESIWNMLETESDEGLPQASPVSAAPRIPGKIEFRNLRFKFPNTDRWVLQNISFIIEPGQRVAFLGAIGSGKSALLSLVPHLYPIERGMLFIDDRDVNDWSLGELRHHVGYVGQDVFLFSDTITENVGLSGANQATIEDAVKTAWVHEDIDGFPLGFSTQLGEKGINLSGGQKQRLTIARALAKEPSILVLDDALSSVDIKTEEKILSGLRSRAHRNTEVIAAHRISTIRDADRIAVLENGQLRQLGTHAELVADRRGLYQKLYRQQMLKEDLDAYAEKLESL